MSENLHELSADGIIAALPPAELFDLKQQLARIDVFGPWYSAGRKWIRPEPARPDSRVNVWYCDGETDLGKGWYYRIGFGVLGIAGVSGTEPHATPESCCAAVDETLRQCPGIVLVTHDRTDKT